MASRSTSSASRPPPQNGITYTRDFEVVEMRNMDASGTAIGGDHQLHQPPPGSAPSRRSSKHRPEFMVPPHSYAVSAGGANDGAAAASYDDYDGDAKKSSVKHWIDGFRQASPGTSLNSVTLGGNLEAESRFYDLRTANVRTAHTALARELKGRHLQMIAIGGSIGMHRPSASPHIRRDTCTD